MSWLTPSNITLQDNGEVMALTKQLKPRHEGQRPLATSQGSFSSAARDQKSFEDCVHILTDGGRGSENAHLL